jgi:predicted RNA binding protein YcfA (HicA-like mRNA interferase family)
MLFTDLDDRITTAPNQSGEQIDRQILNKIIKHDLQLNREEFLKHI